MKYVERLVSGELPKDEDIRDDEFCVLLLDGKATGVYFACPCGCGHRYYIPVTDRDAGEEKKEHRWHFWRPMTLHPSVRHLAGCKAHFEIKAGVATICGDSGK